MKPLSVNQALMKTTQPPQQRPEETSSEKVLVRCLDELWSIDKYPWLRPQEGELVKVWGSELEELMDQIGFSELQRRRFAEVASRGLSVRTLVGEELFFAEQQERLNAPRQ